MKRVLLTALLALVPALPASAALVSTYSMTDEAWGTPIAPGKFLADLRGTYLVTSSLTPALALAYGVAPNLEVGLFGAYGLNGLGTSAMAGSLVPLSPYLKVLTPWKLGPASLAFSVGGQIPLQGSTERTVACEGTLVVPLTDALTVDVNLGGGQAFLAPATLGHVSAAAYYNLPSSQQLLLELYSYVSTTAAPNFGQHLGLLQPLTSSLSLDLSVTVNELPGSALQVLPQVGLTSLF